MDVVVRIGIAPHGVMCLNVWPLESGTIRSCGLLGEGVTFLEEVCHC